MIIFNSNLFKKIESIEEKLHLILKIEYRYERHSIQGSSIKTILILRSNNTQIIVQPQFRLITI